MYSLKEGRKGYVHVARGAVQVNGHALRAGDALKTDAGRIEIERGEGAEVLVFDLPGDTEGRLA
jgi:redox-sensitive bicupin YhaK (pirin superfamily)